MFEVTCKGPYPAMRSIAQGVGFGVIGKPLIFEVKTETIAIPLIVNFYIKSDPEKSPALFVINEIVNGNSIDLDFYNIASSGSAGLTQPATIVSINGVDLQMIVQVDKMFNSDVFRLSYQFFESVVEGAQE